MRLNFATFADYSSRGQGPESLKSRKLCDGIKAGNERALTSLAKALSSERAEPIRDFLAADRTLVPIPGSGKTTPENFWGPRLICEALAHEGIGAGVLPLLIRNTGVPKSAFAAAGERPTPQRHFESIKAEIDLTTPRRITLVDDVVTKGSTAIGAARRIRHELPDCDIKLFAVFRTCNFAQDIERCINPRSGNLTYADTSDAVRRID